MSKINGVFFKIIKSNIDDRGFFKEIFKENDFNKRTKSLG